MPNRYASLEIQGPSYDLLPENAPIVACDIKLGKDFQNVVFDYDNFYWYADKIGFETNEQPSLKIQISKPTKLPLAGHFNSDNAVSIHVSDDINKRLKHEMSHALDHQIGNQGNKARTVIGNVGSFLIYPLAAVTIADFLADAAGAQELDSLVSNPPVSLGRWAVLAACLWGYYFNPEERRARKATKQDASNIIHLLERTSLK